MSILTRGLGDYNMGVVVQQVNVVIEHEVEFDDYLVDCEVDDLAVVGEFGDIIAEVGLEESDD